MTKDFPGASYDNWKTTDPADYAPENKPERDPDDAYDEWRDRQMEDKASGMKLEDGSELTAADLASIIVTHINPPIPMRSFDYQAARADWDLGYPLGFGETPEAAIMDLLAAEETMQDD
jgi:hypothetical protein